MTDHLTKMSQVSCSLAEALDDLIEKDLDAAERLIEKHLARLALKKHLRVKQQAALATLPSGHTATIEQVAGEQATPPWPEPPAHLFEDGSAIWAPIMRWAGNQNRSDGARFVKAVDDAIKEAMREHALQAVRAVLAAKPLPPDCDVRNILLAVVPGDGNGEEVFAKSNDEVVAKLTQLAEEVESLREQPLPESAKRTTLVRDERAGYIADLHDTLNKLADAFGVERGNPELLIEFARAALVSEANSLTQPAPEAAKGVPAAVDYAASMSFAVTREWMRGWDDCIAFIRAQHFAATPPAPEAQQAAINWSDAADWLERESKAVYGVCLAHHAEAAQWLRDTSTTSQAQPAPQQPAQGVRFTHEVVPLSREQMQKIYAENHPAGTFFNSAVRSYREVERACAEAWGVKLAGEFALPRSGSLRTGGGEGL